MSEHVSERWLDDNDAWKGFFDPYGRVTLSKGFTVESLYVAFFNRAIADFAAMDEEDTVLKIHRG